MFDFMELYLIIVSMRKYASKKSVKNIKKHQQYELFLKASRTLTSFPPRPSQHTKLISTIIHQIKRPQTSKRLKNDYEFLIDLANCNRKIIQNQQKSIIRYKQMKSINSQKNQQFFGTLFVQIQNTQGKLYKKKYNKYEMSKLNNYLLNSNQHEQFSSKNLIQNIMPCKIKDIKNCIPSQAELMKKLTILSNLLQQQKQYHIEEIKKIIIKEMQKNGGGKINRKCIIYIINHYIIEQLLLKVHNDSSALGLKNQNRQIYEEIKKQMVKEIINQKTFKQVLKQIQEYQKISYRPHQSIIKYQPKNKNKYPKNRRMSSVQNLQSTIIKNKQIDLTAQFQNIYQKVQQKLKNTRSQLSFSCPRKNNYFSSPDDFLDRFSQL